ncbi:MAG: MBL fold metallo-hydrolase [Campylobacterota bacterium]|nr:MBL fold metallo-hydrolase [Campylobacterota bacterium]
MNIKSNPMGAYQTNCYIVTVDGKDFIIDPGIDATSWVLENTTNPIAILNTHGHFDHVWSNKELKEKLEIPIYCPREDCFMLKDDPFSQGTPASQADFEVIGDQTFDIDGVKIVFNHFPGHTPGCSTIAIENHLFSGDFIFDGSIGRVDFPYSNPQDMINSINKVLKWEDDFIVYPGHGEKTTLKAQANSLKNWLNYL